ncbi:MAG: LemA family protein [candidate division Zixibacteria bacterium]|nr:LemA family protein [candidate division Zixibacteria bacterium]
MVIVFLFLFLLFIAPIIFIVFIYNRLVSQKNSVDEKYSQIDVLLTKRADLIPNLVETVKGYAKHEKNVLENVTAHRASMIGAKDAGDKFKASEGLSGALKSLFAVVENYPDLKADSSFRDLQAQLAQVESEIVQTRMVYNQQVKSYNTLQETFPANMFASSFGHDRRPFYEAVEEKKEPPKVSF